MTSSLRAVIVDSDADSTAALKRILAASPSVVVVGEFVNARQAVQKIPILGDIPILGALFRSSRFQNNETELLFLVTVKLVKPDLPGAGPDAAKLMELRPDEKKEFTLVPGIPGVGEVVRKPFGQSNLPGN